MRRIIYLALFAISVLCPAISTGQTDRFTGTMRVEFGYSVQPDGTIRSLKGLVLPIRGERIRTVPVDVSEMKRNLVAKSYLKSTPFATFLKSIKPNPLLGGTGGLRRTMSSATVYNADAGEPYGIIDPAEFDDPSSLDDMFMAGGAGIPWQELTFGTNLIGTPHTMLVRWRCYGTYNSSADPGVQAFSNEFADFGGYILGNTFPGEGSWKLTVGIAGAGVVSPNNQTYVAQQFRQPQFPEQGEGAFDTAFRNVYSTQAGPTVGTSDNLFWFDSDVNGIYSTDEIDVLGDVPFSNFLRTKTASGTQDTLTPTSVTVIRGRDVQGTLSNLNTSNDFYYSLRPSVFDQPNVPSIQIAVEGEPVTNTALSLRFHVESATLNGGAVQRISLFNFSTGVYDLVYGPTAASGTDAVVEVTVTNNPSRYIQPADASNPPKVRALLAYSRGVFGTSAWRVRFDRTIWVITR